MFYYLIPFRRYLQFAVFLSESREKRLYRRSGPSVNRSLFRRPGEGHGSWTLIFEGVWPPCSGAFSASLPRRLRRLYTGSSPRATRIRGDPGHPLFVPFQVPACVPSRGIRPGMFEVRPRDRSMAEPLNPPPRVARVHPPLTGLCGPLRSGAPYPFPRHSL